MEYSFIIFLIYSNVLFLITVAIFFSKITEYVVTKLKTGIVAWGGGPKHAYEKIIVT